MENHFQGTVLVMNYCPEAIVHIDQIFLLNFMSTFLYNKYENMAKHCLLFSIYNVFGVSNPFNSYMYIHMSSVNFELIPESTVDLYHDYDYASIMHYDGTAFGRIDARTKQPLVTMVPLKVVVN